MKLFSTLGPLCSVVNAPEQGIKAALKYSSNRKSFTFKPPKNGSGAEEAVQEAEAEKGKEEEAEAGDARGGAGAGRRGGGWKTGRRWFSARSARSRRSAAPGAAQPREAARREPGGRPDPDSPLRHRTERSLMLEGTTEMMRPAPVHAESSTEQVTPA